jgi:queuine/archaeosine tRNA-ribosyltransferase
MTRPSDFHIGGVSLALPAFFPSVSSIKANRAPLDYVQFLVAVGAPRFLISAYDVWHCPELTELKSTISSALEHNTLVLLDSGNYERYWTQDPKWTTSRFHEVLSYLRWPAVFSFDVHCDEHAHEQECARKIVDSSVTDRSGGSHALFPIVHGNSKQLPLVCGAVAQLLNPLAIAVAERELGDGILARMDTVRQIRRSLDRLGSYYVLHLLGTGNPTSMLLYALAGADMFDGLEWCQTVADPENARLLHFQQRELLNVQLAPAAMESYEVATLTHNLIFYDGWMRELQTALASGSLSDCAREKLGGTIDTQLAAILNDR